jgi:DNA-directed RNA polymerase specialized sigma24 family protein
LEGHTGLEVQELIGWNHTLIRIRAYRARLRMKKEYAILMENHE